jgi:hypothetical protein
VTTTWCVATILAFIPPSSPFSLIHPTQKRVHADNDQDNDQDNDNDNDADGKSPIVDGTRTGRGDDYDEVRCYLSLSLLSPILSLTHDATTARRQLATGRGRDEGEVTRDDGTTRKTRTQENGCAREGVGMVRTRTRARTSYTHRRRPRRVTACRRGSHPRCPGPTRGTPLRCLRRVVAAPLRWKGRECDGGGTWVRPSLCWRRAVMQPRCRSI